MQDTFAAALATWPEADIPDNPAAWLTAVARRGVLDQLRRKKTRREKTPFPATIEFPVSAENDIPDDRLRLIFTCCHPALDREARIALTLRRLGGPTSTEIARSFPIPEPAIAQRLMRAKKKIRGARNPVRSARPRALRTDARRTRESRPAAADAAAGFAPRRANRPFRPTDYAGVPGSGPVGSCTHSGRAGAVAGEARGSLWHRIEALCAQPARLHPSPVVELNRAAAVAMAEGARPAWLSWMPGLEEFHLFHAARTNLLHRLNRDSEAAAAYRRPLGLVTNPVERSYPEARLEAMERKMES